MAWTIEELEEFARNGFYSVINDGKLVDLVKEKNSATDGDS